MIATKKLETLELEANEQILSPQVKSLYIDVPVSEAIEVALRCLYSCDTPLDTERSTIKLLIKLAVTNVHFISNGN